MITESYPSERRLSGDFFLRSDDMLEPLRSEDVLLGAGLDALTSGDFLTRLQSGDIVKDILLPDSKVTAAAAVSPIATEKADAPATARHEEAKGKEGKIGKLRAKRERRASGDEFVPLNKSFRASSGDWIKDLETESRYLSSLLLGNHPSSSKGDSGETSAAPLPFRSRMDNYNEYQVPLRSSWSKPSLKNADRISSSDWVGDFKNESVNLGPMHPSLFVASMTEQLDASPPPLSVPLASHLAHHPLPSAPKASLTANTPSTTSTAGTNAPPSTSTASKRKKSRKRTLDETVAVEPTDGDVLSGRGGFTNTHPGNIRFRKKALEFRSWYEESSKEKKQEIADLLVDSVRNEGNRFLGKGKDGLWHEMTGNGPHRKASQALRERLNGK